MKKNIALIDDDPYWLDWMESKIQNHNISKYIDWRTFYLHEDISYFHCIITDFLFFGYNIEDTDIEKILKKSKFTGKLYLITHNPRDVKKEEIFERIFDKGAIKRNKFFSFEKYI